MSDIDKMKKLKEKYTDLLNTHGKEFTEHEEFRHALLLLNKQHRMKAIQMYSDMISRIESKVEREAGKTK